MTVKRTALFDILETRGISKRWFAKQIGIHESALSRILKGERGMPAQYRVKAAQVLQVPETLLFFDDHVPEGTSEVRKVS